MIFCKKEQSLKAISIKNIILVRVTLCTMKHTWYTLTLMDGVEILCLGKLGLSIGTSLYFDTHKFCQRLMVALKHTRFAAKILPHTIYLSENNLSIIVSLEISNLIWYKLIFFQIYWAPIEFHSPAGLVMQKKTNFKSSEYTFILRLFSPNKPVWLIWAVIDRVMCTTTYIEIFKNSKRKTQFFV